MFRPRQKTAFPRGGLSEYESSGFSGFLSRLRRAIGGGSSSSSSSTSTSASPVASASASSLSSSWCWQGINSFCWMLTCCKGRGVLTIASLFAVAILLLLVFQGKELLLSQCIVASIPTNERSSRIVWELWQDTHLGEDCPLAAATPRFAWLEPNGTLRVPGCKSPIGSDPQYSYSLLGDDSISDRTKTSKRTEELGILGGSKQFREEEEVVIEHEYVKVTCTFPPPLGLQTNILVHNAKSDKAFGRAKQLLGEETKLNVIVLLISSLSEAHFQRVFPLTNEYLLSPSLPSTLFQMNGFTAMGSDALQNQAPLLLGRLLERDQVTGSYHLTKEDSSKNEARAESGSQSAPTNEQWIWEFFKQSGYVTMYAEEECIVNNSVRKFFHPKTSSEDFIDHRFTEAFCLLEPTSDIDPKGGDDWSETNFDELELSVRREEAFLEQHTNRNHKNKNFWKHGPSCIGNRRVHTLTMDYIVQFMDNYDGVGRFATGIFSAAKERTMMRIKSMDADLRSLFVSLQKRGHLNQTAVFLVSDIGLPQETGYRTMSKAGSTEWKLPLLKVVLPSWLERTHSSLFETLDRNQNRLTTSLDLHQTLKHIAQINVSTPYRGVTWNHSKRSATHSFSLLETVPLTRTCSEARISSESCACEDLSLIFVGFLLLPSSILCWWCYSWFRSARRSNTRRTIFVKDLTSI